MKAKKLSVLGLAIGCVGVLGAMTTMKEQPEEQGKKVEVTIQNKSNGTWKVNTAEIEVSSREDITRYLEQQGINTDKLNYYESLPHGDDHQDLWVWNKSGKALETQVKVINFTGNGDPEELRTKMKNHSYHYSFDSDDLEGKDVKVIRVEQESNNGKVTTKKWVNGQEVDADDEVDVDALLREHLTDEEIERIKDLKKERGSNVVIKRKDDASKGKSKEMRVHRIVHREFIETETDGLDFMANSVDGNTMIQVRKLERKNGTTVPHKNTLELSEVQFYPNPTQGKVNIAFDLEKDGKVMMEILNLEGKKVYSQQYNTTDLHFEETVELNDIEPGVYVITIKQENKVFSKKLLVQ